jgi:DNA (cytosine-5-)-methyltransferase
MKFIDFFSGIGGFHTGLEKAGMKCIGWCEFDKFAQASYRAMYDTDNLWFGDDVTKVKGKDLPTADLWAFGFPCQDVSIAGKQKGIKEGTRSGLFYEIMRLIDECKENKPQWLMCENVKNLLSIDGGAGSSPLLVKWQKEGIVSNGKCTIPKTTEYHKIENECTLLDVLENDAPAAFYLSEEQTQQFLTRL